MSKALAVTAHVPAYRGTYDIVVPVGPSGIAFLGDMGKFASLGKQRIHLGCLERPDERVQGLLNDSVNLLLALPSVHWVKPDILIGSLPAVAVQVDDAPRIRMVAAPHDREHPAEGVTGNRRVDQLQVLPDDAYIAQRICP